MFFIKLHLSHNIGEKFYGAAYCGALWIILQSKLPGVNQHPVISIKSYPSDRLLTVCLIILPPHYRAHPHFCDKQHIQPSGRALRTNKHRAFFFVPGDKQTCTNATLWRSLGKQRNTVRINTLDFHGETCNSHHRHIYQLGEDVAFSYLLNSAAEA